MSRPLLHILIGPPGAGKTTYAQYHFPPESIISADEIREQLTGWRRDDPIATWKYIAPAQAKVARAIADAILTRLRQGLPTIYDSTNLLARNRRSLLSLVPKQVRVKYLVFDRPLDEKLASRGWRPASLVERQHAKFQAELPAILAGDGFAFIEVEDLRPSRARIEAHPPELVRSRKSGFPSASG